MSYATNAPVLARHGLDLGRKGWPQETACRLPLNNLRVTGGRKRLNVHGGRGKTARDRDCCFSTIDMLKA